MKSQLQIYCGRFRPVVHSEGLVLPEAELDPLKEGPVLVLRLQGLGALPLPLLDVVLVLVEEADDLLIFLEIHSSFRLLLQLYHLRHSRTILRTVFCEFFLERRRFKLNSQRHPNALVSISQEPLNRSPGGEGEDCGQDDGEEVKSDVKEVKISFVEDWVLEGEHDQRLYQRHELYKRAAQQDYSVVEIFGGFVNLAQLELLAAVLQADADESQDVDQRTQGPQESREQHCFGGVPDRALHVHLNALEIVISLELDESSATPCCDQRPHYRSVDFLKREEIYDLAEEFEDEEEKGCLHQPDVGETVIELKDDEGQQH